MRFIPGVTCCSSCSGERVPNNLSTRSTFDFHPRSAASISEFSVVIVVFLFQLLIESYVEFFPEWLRSAQVQAPPLGRAALKPTTPHSTGRFDAMPTGPNW